MRANQGMLTAVFALTILACLLFAGVLPVRAQAVPHYKFDPTWPKTLPHNWMLANAPGLFVDKNDHIWVSNRPRQLAQNDAAAAQTPPTSECCIPAPTLIEFDAQGNVLKSWGGPGYVADWPILEHGLFLDGEGNFWIGGNYQAAFANLLSAPIPKPKDPSLYDRHVLKFSPDGKLLLEIGHPSNAPANNQDTSILGAPSEVVVDDAAHEVYIADGYLNRRVVVYDSDTGAFKRGWGAYGMPLSEIENGRLPARDPAVPDKQFRGVVGSIEMSEDGFIYVGDRGGDRIQIFTKEGKFVKEFLVRPDRNGTVGGMMFSRDPKQKYLYVADGADGVILVLNRADGTEVDSIGHKGRWGGQFDGIELMALDSHGNLYTSEVNPNTRIQKFVPAK